MFTVWREILHCAILLRFATQTPSMTPSCSAHTSHTNFTHHTMPIIIHLQYCMSGDNRQAHTHKGRLCPLTNGLVLSLVRMRCSQFHWPCVPLLDLEKGVESGTLLLPSIVYVICLHALPNPVVYMFVWYCFLYSSRCCIFAVNYCAFVSRPWRCFDLSTIAFVLAIGSTSAFFFLFFFFFRFCNQ